MSNNSKQERYPALKNAKKITPEKWDFAEPAFKTKCYIVKIQNKIDIDTAVACSNSSVN